MRGTVPSWSSATVSGRNGTAVAARSWGNGSESAGWGVCHRRRDTARLRWPSARYCPQSVAADIGGAGGRSNRVLPSRCRHRGPPGAQTTVAEVGGRAGARTEYGRWMASAAPASARRDGAGPLSLIPASHGLASVVREEFRATLQLAVGICAIYLVDYDRQRLRLADGEAQRTLTRDRAQAGAGRDVGAPVRSASG